MRNTFDVGTNGSLVLNNFDGNYWDKYEGYDLNKDKIGDIPYRPVSLFSMILEKIPPAMMLFRSFMVTLLDKTRKLFQTSLRKSKRQFSFNESIQIMITINNVYKSFGKIKGIKMTYLFRAIPPNVSH